VPELPVPTALHSATRQLTSIPPPLEPCPASTPAGFGNPDGRPFSLGYKLHALLSGPSKGAHVVPVDRHLPKGQSPSTWGSRETACISASLVLTARCWSGARSGTDRAAGCRRRRAGSSSVFEQLGTWYGGAGSKVCMRRSGFYSERSPNPELS